MKHENTLFALLLAGTIALFATTSALAQATIDQNKALAGSVTPGDSPGFPVSIAVPGAYKLTGNLVVPAGLNGIEILTEGVTIDLNGFRIASGGVCTRNGVSFAVTCNNPAMGKHGIHVAGSVASVIRNGTIQGFEMGVMSLGGVVESLVVKHNGTGVHFESYFAASRATGITAEMNQTGVMMGWGLIERSVATANQVGFAGATTASSSVAESHTTHNAIGIRDAAIRANRVSANKVDLSGTVAF